jgi:hypothetical protein
MSDGDSMKLAAHCRIKRDDQGRTVRASSASRNRKFESTSLQRGVYLSSAPPGCRRKAPHFGGGLRVAGDVRRDVQAANRDSFALLSDRH